MRERRRGALSSIIKLYLIRGAFYGRVLAVICVIPFALACPAATAASPTPTATPPPPAVQPATYVASNSFTANWSSVSAATGYRLDVSTSSSFTSYVPGDQNLNVGNVTSRSVTGLNASTAYHYRVRAYNSGGATSSNSNVVTVTTLSATGSPVVITNPATLVASFSATLNGMVDPHGLSTSVYFQYGPTTNYGSTTPAQTRNGNTYQSVSANVSGLAASATYHFRIVATNSGGTRYGSDTSFTTLSATGAPIVATNPATNIASSSASLNGAVDPHGLSTTVHFHYGTTTSYGSATVSQTKTGNTYQNVHADITGLTAGTIYHFRIVGTNSAGTRYGLDRTFAAVPPDQSVTWQNNPTHDGFDPASPLVPPLRLKWSRDLSANGVTFISYPLIAQGLVFVTTTTNQGRALMALDEHTGATVWSRSLNGTWAFVNAAYDSGKVFVINFDGLLKAFDAATGALLWSVNAGSNCTSPPTAANGIVFTSGAGNVYSVNEANGAVLWTMPVNGGDHSSPAVTLGGVFVSYVGPQAYAFSPITGQQLWHYSCGFEGGGGKTPVVHAAQLYVRDSYCTPANGLVLNANTGALIRGFRSNRPPAFLENLGLFLQNGTLSGVNSTNGQILWSFTGDGMLTSAPLVVNQTIYVGSNSGMLYGLNSNGQQVWSTQVGAEIGAPDEQNTTLTTGLGAGDGLLIVPAGSNPRNILAAYGN